MFMSNDWRNLVAYTLFIDLCLQNVLGQDESHSTQCLHCLEMREANDIPSRSRVKSSAMGNILFLALRSILPSSISAVMSLFLFIPYLYIERSSCIIQQQSSNCCMAQHSLGKSRFMERPTNTKKATTENEMKMPTAESMLYGITELDVDVGMSAVGDIVYISHIRISPLPFFVWRNSIHPHSVWFACSSRNSTCLVFVEVWTHFQWSSYLERSKEYNIVFLSSRHIFLRNSQTRYRNINQQQKRHKNIISRLNIFDKSNLGLNNKYKYCYWHILTFENKIHFKWSLLINNVKTMEKDKAPSQQSLTPSHSPSSQQADVIKVSTYKAIKHL